MVPRHQARSDDDIDQCCLTVCCEERSDSDQAWGRPGTAVATFGPPFEAARSGPFIQPVPKCKQLTERKFLSGSFRAAGMRSWCQEKTLCQMG